MKKIKHSSQVGKKTPHNLYRIRFRSHCTKQTIPTSSVKTAPPHVDSLILYPLKTEATEPWTLSSEEPGWQPLPRWMPWFKKFQGASDLQRRHWNGSKRLHQLKQSTSLVKPGRAFLPNSEETISHGSRCHPGPVLTASSNTQAANLEWWFPFPS